MSPQPEMIDSWTSWDQPILHSIVARYEADGHVTAQQVLEDTGLDWHIVGRRVRVLRGRWIDADMDPGDGFTIFGISDEARTTLGAWPSPERAADRLLAAVQEAIEQAATPEERGRLEKVRDGLASVGRDLLVSIGSAVITGHM